MDLRTRTKQPGANEKARSGTSRFSKEFSEDWTEEIVEDGFWSLREYGEDKPWTFRFHRG